MFTNFQLYKTILILSDEVQIGPETVMTTLYTAKKYAVPALEKHCVDFLKRNLSPDNAFMLLTQVIDWLLSNQLNLSAGRADLPVGLVHIPDVG